MQINRGEIWSVAWTGFARMPRPALVIQAEEYRLTETDILALITTTESEANALRLPVKADAVMQEVNERLIKILGIG